MRATWLSLILLAPLVGAAVPAPSAAWVITSDTTIEDVPFVFLQDVVVMPGATLHLKNVDALAARNVNFTIHGELDITDGSRLASAAFPFALYVAPGGRVGGRDASFIGGALHVAGLLAVERSTLTSVSLRIADGGNATITNATFDGAVGPAAHATRGATLRLADSMVGRTTDYGVRVENARAVIENTTFALSPEYAIYAQNAEIDILRNDFSTHCGAFLVAGTRGKVEGNNFQTLDHGITFVLAGNMSVTGNVFSGTNEALLSFSSTPLVSQNRFLSNSMGVHVSPGSASAPILRNNTFAGNGVAVKNDATPSVDASQNWWGAAGGPGSAGADSTTGNVAVSPWLLSPP